VKLSFHLVWLRTSFIFETNDRGHFQPEVYSGPGVSVLSSTVTSSSFSAQLKLTNATSWSNSGSLNINSDTAGIVWAFGTSAPSNPSNSGSNFQQHRSRGTFSIDMKAAQVQEAVASQSGASATSGVASPTLIAAPTITGAIVPTDNGTGLTHRDKVSHLKTRLTSDYYCTWSHHGLVFCHSFPPRCNHHPFLGRLPPRPNKTPLHNPNHHLPRCPISNGSRSLSLPRHPIHPIPYAPLNPL
jgi:hypothetical protein